MIVRTSLQARLIALVVVAGSLSALGAAQAAEYSVRSDGTGDYTTIQAAINACVDGDVVVVADGTYTGSGNQNLDFGGRDITVRSQYGPAGCIIDPTFARAFHFHSGETNAAILQGFTIRNAYIESGNGAAILCEGAWPTIVDMVIRDCQAAGDGGAIAAINSGDLYLTLYNNVISRNDAQGDGGGVYAEGGRLRMRNNTVDLNAAARGGGLYFGTYSSVDITNNIFWGNQITGPYPGTGQVGGSMGGTFLSGNNLIEDWSAGTGTNFDGNPQFVGGPLGDRYLYQATSDAVDAGTGPSSGVCLTTADGTVCMDLLTTRTTGQRDTGTVDVGYHYGLGAEDLNVPAVFGTIQAAINAAGPGDRVQVAPGSYPENIDFIGKDITVRSTGGPAVTTINGGAAGSVVRFVSGEGSDAVLEGFTVTNGGTNLGGGIHCLAASPTITGNVIASNEGYSAGGGIFCSTGANPAITGNVIRNNWTAGRGGGLSCSGSSPILSGNTFHLNAADNNGGAVACDATSHPTAANTIFTRNQAMGGLAVLCDPGGSLTLSCCDVWDSPGGNWVGGLAGQEGVDGNFSADPAYCDVGAYDLTLFDVSPCAAANNPGCGQVGALGVGCTYVPVTRVVDPAGGGDYTTIQAAIDAAFDGDTVSLVDAVYSGPGNWDVTTRGKAILVRSASGDRYACRLDAQNAHRGFVFDSGEGPDTEVRGIGVFNGAAATGAGILCTGASPTLDNLYIGDCDATDDGGGLHLQSYASPVIRGCLFENNSAVDDGGGLYAATWCSPDIDDCTFLGNLAGDRGAGAVFSVNCFPTIDGSTFRGNEGANGGGLTFVYAYGPVTDCVFLDNTGTWGGGFQGYGNAQVVLTRCTFSGNTAANGSGVYVRNNSSPTFNNCIVAFGVVGAAFDRYATDCNPTLACSDVWGNAGGDWTAMISAQNGIDGNIWSDPLFCDAPNGDLTVANTSPCSQANNPACGQIGALGVGCYTGAQTWWVYPGGGGDFPTIQAAIDAADDGDTILLGAGTFTGTGNRDLSYHGKEITIRGQSGGSPTVIDCQGGAGNEHRGFYFGTAEGPASVLAHVTVTGGYAWDGGGLHATEGVAPTIRDCRFVGNTSTDDGGGIFMSFGCGPRLVRCEVADNIAANRGGGIYGHDSVAELDSCTVTGNAAGSLGGGIYTHQAGSVDLADCLIAGNTATNGGGVYVQGPANSSLLRVRFAENAAVGSGGGYYERDGAVTSFDHCEFQGNTADLGGGVYNVFSCAEVFANCTFTGNTATTRGGAMRIYTQADVTLIGCLLWGDASGLGDEIAIASSCTMVVNCSDVAGGVAAIDDYAHTSTITWGTGNIDAFPYFCDAPGGDLGLVGLQSPCLPAGNTCGVLMGAHGAGCSSPSAVDEDDVPPPATLLAAARPNPFNPKTSIDYALAKEGPVRLVVHDARGRLVRVLLDDVRPAGAGSVAWDGRDARGRSAGAGVYFYSLEADGVRLTGKMTLLK